MMAYTQVLSQSGDFHGLFSHADYSLKMQVSRGEGHIITNDKHISFLKKTLFLERGEGKEKERGRNTNVWLPLACPPPPLRTWPTTQACALTGNHVL